MVQARVADLEQADVVREQAQGGAVEGSAQDGVQRDGRVQARLLRSRKMQASHQRCPHARQRHLLTPARQTAHTHLAPSMLRDRRLLSRLVWLRGAVKWENAENFTFGVQAERLCG